MNAGHAIDAIQSRLEKTLGSGRLPTGAEQRGAQLLARLKSPVSVVVIGPPDSGKSSIINMLLGQAVIPENRDLPVLEVVAGAAPRTVFSRQDGSQDSADGIALEDVPPADTVLARIEVPAPVLSNMSLTEIRVAGTFAEQRAAVDLAVRLADIVLWCTQSFSAAEQNLWAGVPDELKDHSFMVLTKADRFLMQGTLETRIADLNAVVAEEFYSLFPVATLQAIAARASEGSPNPPLWKASGGRALAYAVIKQVATGRAADADSALLFLSRFNQSETHPDGMDSVRPKVESTPEARDAKPGVEVSVTNAQDGDASLARALGFLAERTGALTQALPDNAADTQSFVLDHCLETATELAEILMQGASDESAVGDLQSDLTEGMDMMLLLQLEQTEDAAEDAVTLLLQLKKELTEKAVGIQR